MKLSSRYKERFRRTLTVHRGRAVDFRIDEIRLPDGRTARREFLAHPGAVGALAFAPDGKILLVKQYRYPVGEFTLEIPAGKLSKGEAPLACVRRELEEETGFVAGKIRKLISFWPTAAFSDEVIHLYIAENLRPTRMKPDDDEYLELVRVSPEQFDRLIRQGKIHDSKTLIAHLYWKTFGALSAQ